MPRRKVDDEVEAQIQRLKSRGEKDSDIARKLGLDPRTVRSALSRMSKVMDYEHWTAVSRQVDSNLLQRHYDDLVTLALSIQEQLRRDLSGLADSSPSFQSHNSLEGAINGLFMERASESTIARIVAVSHWDSLYKVPWERRRALGNRLLKGMGSHEPQLQEALDLWYRAFDSCQELKGILCRDAKNALEKELLDEDVLRDTVPIILKELWELTMNNAAAGVFETLEQPNASYVYLIRKMGHTQGQVRLGGQEEADDYRQLYDEVLNPLVRSRAVAKFKIAVDGLPQLKDHVDAIIDDLVLRGRPDGRCELCPFAFLNNLP